MPRNRLFDTLQAWSTDKQQHAAELVFKEILIDHNSHIRLGKYFSKVITLIEWFSDDFLPHPFRKLVSNFCFILLNAPMQRTTIIFRSRIEFQIGWTLIKNKSYFFISLTSVQMNLWPLFSSLFDWFAVWPVKKWEKSVQLIRGSFVPK